MAAFKAPRGTADVLPAEAPRWRFIEEKFREVCRLYGFQELRTPTFEEAELFIKHTGESTDIVGKEMYTFTDRAGRLLALRAEGTPPTVRAYLEHNLAAEMSVAKLYYIARIFRYERPQAGRYREHTQFGVELIGSDDPASDAEVMALADQFLRSVGVTEIELKINAIGCPKCRPAYREALRAYVGPLLADPPLSPLVKGGNEKAAPLMNGGNEEPAALIDQANEDSVFPGKEGNEGSVPTVKGGKERGGFCEACRRRYEINPLRMLDCKEKTCRALLASAPVPIDYLDEECRARFQSVQEALRMVGLEFEIDPRLVRGFDYYTGTVFEFQSGRLGAQNTVCGGGRYDLMVEEMGGPPTPALGFGLGAERLLLVLKDLGVEIPADERLLAFVATIGETARAAGIRLLAELRRMGISADTEYTGKSLKAQMRLADKRGARFVVILGEEEVNRGMAAVRDMATKEQKEVPLDAVAAALKESACAH